MSFYNGQLTDDKFLFASEKILFQCKEMVLLQQFVAPANQQQASHAAQVL